MKKSRLLGALCAVLFTFITTSSHAVLIGILPETSGGSDWQAYYDDVADLTWLKNANANGAMTWDAANTWAAGLDIAGVTGWRLPDTIDVGNDGATFTSIFQGVDYGYNITTHSELSNMFYNALGNTAWYDTSGVEAGCTAPNYCLTNTSPFSNVQSSIYWSATEWAPSTGSAWVFLMTTGAQDVGTKTDSHYAWAVHTGDASLVPIPPAIDIEKLTNGNQADGANDSDVPSIAQGMTVNWTYEITNIGGTALSEAEILVTDSQPGIVPVLDTGSDVSGDMILSPGEIWTYTANAQALDLRNPPVGVTVVQGCNNNRNTYQNIGRAEITGTFDEDFSHYCNPTNDTDSDGIPDNLDNCTLIANTAQRDTNGDGYGNWCDADLNGDLTVNLSDFSLFRTAFGTPGSDADFNGDGTVNLSDFSIFRASFGSAPGPSCCVP